MRMDGLEGGAHDSARCRHDEGAQLECTCGSSRRRIEEDGAVEEEGRNRGLQRTPCSSEEILGSRRGSLPLGRRWRKAGRLLGLALLSALLCPTVSSTGGSSAAPLRRATSAAGTQRPTSCSPSPMCFRGAPGQEVEGWAGVMGKVSREFEGARESIRKKRLEIEYEEASQLEEAFAHSQIWINPLQGWNQMQRAVDLAAKDSAFVKSPLWPVTAFLLVKDAVVEAGTRSPVKNWLPSRFSRRNGQPPVRDVAWTNSQLVSTALSLNDSDGWEPVSSADGVQVWRMYIPADLVIAGEPVGRASQFAAVKARGVLNAPLDRVYSLFTDNERVGEYNEYCKEIRDLEWLDESTKVTYSSTGRPWCRDFVTRVHYTTLEDNTRMVVNRAEEHPMAPRKTGYSRMGMSVGASVMRPLPGGRTEFTMLTHVNPGGMANTKFGAVVTNRLSTESPRAFLQSIGKVLDSDSAKAKAKAKAKDSDKDKSPGGAAIATAGAAFAAPQSLLPTTGEPKQQPPPSSPSSSSRSPPSTVASSAASRAQGPLWGEEGGSAAGILCGDGDGARPEEGMSQKRGGGFGLFGITQLVASAGDGLHRVFDEARHPRSPKLSPQA